MLLLLLLLFLFLLLLFGFGFGCSIRSVGIPAGQAPRGDALGLRPVSPCWTHSSTNSQYPADRTEDEPSEIETWDPFSAGAGNRQTQSRGRTSTLTTPRMQWEAERPPKQWPVASQPEGSARKGLAVSFSAEQDKLKYFGLTTPMASQ